MSIFRLEQGRKFRFIAGSITSNVFTGYDLSAVDAGTLAIAFKKPSGRILTKTATIGGTTVTFSGVTIPAVNWCEVEFSTTDINESGPWQCQLIFDLSGDNAGSVGWQDAFTVVPSAYAAC
jgi:hypothetical protein